MILTHCEVYSLLLLSQFDKCSPGVVDVHNDVVPLQF